MKTIVLSALLVTAASVAEARTVYYPQNACAEIVSAEYSTGGGDTAYELYEILCKDANGKYTSFVTSWVSVSGMFGLGRAFHEEVISLVPYDGATLTSDD